MSLSRFTEQTELYDLIDFYIQSYETKHPENGWKKFDDFKVIKAIDGAGVVFTPETTLFGDKDRRKKEGVIGKNITKQLMGAISYFLAQNISVDEVPDELRICLAVCHGNSHWTGVISTVKSFKKLYKEIQDYYIKEKILENYCLKEKVSENDLTPTSLRNLINNAIYTKLGVVIEYPIEKKTPEIKRAKLLLEHCKKNDIKIDLTHFDSMNGSYYKERIDQSLQRYPEKKYFDGKTKHIPCSQQKGNTCGDHTIANLFSLSIFGFLPKINHSSSNITSYSLRELTNHLSKLKKLSSNGKKKKKKSIEKEKTQLNVKIEKSREKLMADLYGNGKIPSPITPPKHKEMTTSFDGYIITLVNDLFAIDHENASFFINEARSDQGAKKELKTYLESTQLDTPAAEKLASIVNTLEDIFHGRKTDRTNQLFEKTSEEDLIVYGSLAGLVASDHSAELDHKKLRENKGEIALKEQEETFINYQKTAEVPQKNLTPQMKYRNLVAILRLQKACDAYLDHKQTQLIDPNLDLEYLNTKIDELGKHAKKFDATPYACSGEEPVSTQFYLKINHLKNLLQFKSDQYKKDKLPIPDSYRQIKKSLEPYESYIKFLAITEIRATLETNLDDFNIQKSLATCEKQLNAGKTKEILMLDRQSQGEYFLKILSVIGILAGVGIFTTLGLMAKRLYDTGGRSANFFKPLSEELHQDIEKQFRKIKSPR